MRPEPCANCQGESVYSCRCCPDCGITCNDASACILLNERDTDPSELWDYDDDSDEEEHDPYGED